MDWLYAILLGVLEGLTEFIPVSSTGHLILAKNLLGLDESWDTFIVLIQLGAILAVVAVYFRRFLGILLSLPSDQASRRFVMSVLVAFLPAAVLGVLLHDFIKEVLFESPRVICWSLIVGGVVLLFLDRLSRGGAVDDAMKVPLPKALGVGLMQCLSMIPGVSRSGATIAGGLVLGLDKRAAAEFSFFLAIPTMLGAFAYDLYKSQAAIDSHQVGLIAVGFVTAFVSGLLVVKTFISLVGRHGFAPYAWWRIAVGIVGLVVLALG